LQDSWPSRKTQGSLGSWQNRTIARSRVLLLPTLTHSRYFDAVKPSTCIIYYLCHVSLVGSWQSRTIARSRVLLLLPALTHSRYFDAVKSFTCIVCRVGQNHIYTVYLRYVWLGNHKYTVIYSVYTYTVLANPNYLCRVSLVGSWQNRSRLLLLLLLLPALTRSR